MLAGCGGGSGGDGTPQNREIPDSSDRTFVTTEFNTIRNVNFNPYDVLYHPNQSVYYLHNELYYTSQLNDANPVVEGGEIPHAGLATEIERDGDVVAVTIGDDYTWHDGDPVTADDVAARWTLDLLRERRNWERSFSDCYVEDETTVVVETVPDANDDLLNDFISNTLVNTKPSLYEKFLPPGGEDEDSGERGAGAYDDLDNFTETQIRGELGSISVAAAYDAEGGQDLPVIGNGPWKMERKGERTMLFTPHEGNPMAEEMNFPEVKFEEFTTNQARYQALLSDSLSGLDLVLTQTVWDQLPDNYEKYVFNRTLGIGWAFNHNVFPDHRVRQALAFAMNREQIVANSGLADDLIEVHEYDSALYADEDAHAKYFGEGFVDELTQYDQDIERATALLEEVGWSKDDGQWYDENDEEVSITLKVPPTWSEWVNMVQTATQDLNDFGIDAEFETEELVVYYGQTMNQADFEIAAWWTGGARPFPWFAYNTVWNALQTITDKHRHPEEYEEIPGPIGEHNGDDTFSFNWQEGLTELAATRSETEAHRELSRKLAWTYNQMLPVYCMNENNGCASLNASNWAAPDIDSEAGNVFFPLSYFSNRGLLNAY